MRIALINAPIRLTSPPQHPPYGIALLGAIADLEGYEVAVWDMNAHRLHRDVLRQDLKNEAQDREFSIIGISGFIPSYRWIKETLPFLRRDHPDALIVVGGGAMTSLQKQMMEWCPEIDVGVIGEGERTFKELLDWDGKSGIAGGHMFDLDEIRGILWRDGAGYVNKTAPRSLMTEEELDKLPYPNFDLLPMEEVYWKQSGIAFSPQALLSKRRMPVLSSRGCPGLCKFCTELMCGESRTNYSGEYGPKIRFHSARYVVDLIKYLRLRYAADFINFLDECFTANKERVYEICDLLDEEGLSDVISWGATAHPNQLTPDLIRRCKNAGCTYFDLGIESGDDRVLKAMRKGTSTGKNRQVIQWCIRNQVTPITNFIWGFPEDDLQSMYNTAKFWKDNGIAVRPFWLGPYPLTQYFEEHKEKILSQYGGDLEKFVIACETDTDTMFVNLTKFSDPEIIGLRELAIRHDLERIKKYAEEKGVKLDS